MVLVEGVLLHGVEQGDLLVLLGCEISDRVVSHRVIELDLVDHVLHHELLVARDIVKLRLVVEVVRLFRI